jgi:LacI family transcriptional regulator
MAKRPTARQVAELAGVSRTTVSFVLNKVPGMRIGEDTRQRVIEAARRLEYHPDATARRMVTGRTQVLGFVQRHTPDQLSADALLPRVLSGVCQAARAQGFHVLFEPIPPDDNFDTLIRLARERHVDGIILSGPRYDDQDLMRVREDGTPVVLVGQLPGTGIPYVDVDNSGGAQTAVNHLLALGHRRIGLITNAPPAYTASAERQAGYQRALADAGVAMDEALVRYGDFTALSGQVAVESLLELADRPTALFVASDAVALGALRVLRRRGLRVPEDMALVGFVDIPLAEAVDPPLTTVHVPAQGLGWGAAELLMRLIAADEPIRNPHVVLATELVVRESSGSGPGE